MGILSQFRSVSLSLIQIGSQPSFNERVLCASHSPRGFGKYSIGFSQEHQEADIINNILQNIVTKET